MDIDQLLEIWKKDCEISFTEPGREAIKISSYHAKYLTILSKAKLKLKQVKNEYAEKKNIKWNYYSGHYNTNKELLKELGLEPFKFILKQDMSIYLESDKDLIDIGNKITYYDEMINICNQILLELKNRTWNIKSYIDWRKFEEGN